MTQTIRSARLDLVSLDPEFLDAALAGETRKAGERLGARVPDDWPDLADTVPIFLERLRADPALAPWSIRAIVLRAERRMIGHLGFHAPPGPEGLELGYTVFAPERRRGYAREGCVALMDWAARAHAVERFIVTIAAENEPSLALARQLGFREVAGNVLERRVIRSAR